MSDSLVNQQLATEEMLAREQLDMLNRIFDHVWSTKTRRAMAMMYRGDENVYSLTIPECIEDEDVFYVRVNIRYCILPKFPSELPEYKKCKKNKSYEFSTHNISGTATI